MLRIVALYKLGVKFKEKHNKIINDLFHDYLFYDFISTSDYLNSEKQVLKTQLKAFLKEHRLKASEKRIGENF